MSCPDWIALAAARDAAPTDPPGWEAALRHLDECTTCRRAAVAADPTLAFRSLPPLALDVDHEVEAMRLRVATLRGASAVVPQRRRRALAAMRRLHVSWRLAAAAAIAALAVFAGGNDHHGAAAKPAAVLAAISPSSAAHAPAAVSSALAAELASEPVLDGFDKPFDHVVQWNGDDLSVILVVDQRLGV